MCSISMSFDSIYFEGLARRGSNVASSSKVKKQHYTVKVLSNLDDVLGRRWYIRGLNTVGDFCYAIPGSTKFHLKYCKTKTDYQMQPNGTLAECSYGGGYQLMFQFVRGDGTPSQWNSILNPVHLYSLVPTNDFCSLAIMIGYFSTCSSSVLIEVIKQFFQHTHL